MLPLPTTNPFPDDPDYLIIDVDAIEERRAADIRAVQQDRDDYPEKYRKEEE